LRFKPAPDIPAHTIPVYPAVVERAFRGVEVGSTVYLFRLDPAVRMQAGQQYLIYGAFNFGDSRDVILPTGFTPIEDADADLAFLTSRESLAATTGRIYGVVEQGSIYGQEHRHRLPGVTLRVRVGDFLTETTSDAQGRFDVGGLPEGRFKIEAELPPGLTAGFTGGGEVHAGGCVPTGVVAQWNGIIRGRIVGSDQRPVQGGVELLPTDPRVEGFPREGKVVFSSASGEFEFNTLPPGDYLLGVNLKRPQSGLPYRPTYFPGTSNPAEATTIHVGEGSVHDNVDLVMPPALAIGRLYVRTAAPANGVISLCVESVGTYRQPESGETVAAWVVDGVHYRLRLHIEGAPGKHWESEVVEVVGQPGIHEITVPVTRPARSHPEGVECFPGNQF
jgi:hypothetical protein